MSKVTLSGHILVPEADLAAVRDALADHISATRAEAGCRVFRVEEHATEAGRFDVYEEFESEEAFEFHQQRARSSEWGSLTADVTRHYTIVGLAE